MAVLKETYSSKLVLKDVVSGSLNVGKPLFISESTLRIYDLLYLTIMMNIRNMCSEQQISIELRPLLNEAISLYRNIYRDSLVSLFLAGSIPRGDFVRGESDADFYAVIETDITRELESELRQKLSELSRVWRPHGITSVDGKSIKYNERHRRKNQRTMFILGTDSICIHGTQLKLDFAIPNTADELALMLNENAKKRLKNIDDRLQERRSNSKDIQRIVKLTKRCAFGVALLRGASYSPKHRLYPGVIKQYVPELSTQVDDLLMLSDTNAYPTSEMVNIARKVILFAEGSGLRMVQ